MSLCNAFIVLNVLTSQLFICSVVHSQKVTNMFDVNVNLRLCLFCYWSWHWLWVNRCLRVIERIFIPTITSILYKTRGFTQQLTILLPVMHEKPYVQSYVKVAAMFRQLRCCCWLCLQGILLVTRDLIDDCSLVIVDQLLNLCGSEHYTSSRQLLIDV